MTSICLRGLLFFPPPSSFSSRSFRNSPSTSLICAASSLVGLITRAPMPCSPSCTPLSVSNIGSMNASVFPLPVTASAATSFLRMSMGAAAACTGVAPEDRKPSLSKVPRREGDNAGEREDQGVKRTDDDMVTLDEDKFTDQQRLISWTWSWTGKSSLLLLLLCFVFLSTCAQRNMLRGQSEREIRKIRGGGIWSWQTNTGPGLKKVWIFGNASFTKSAQENQKKLLYRGN